MRVKMSENEILMKSWWCGGATQRETNFSVSRTRQTEPNPGKTRETFSIDSCEKLIIIFSRENSARTCSAYWIKYPADNWQSFDLIYREKSRIDNLPLSLFMFTQKRFSRQIMLIQKILLPLWCEFVSPFSHELPAFNSESFHYQSE